MEEILEFINDILPQDWLDSTKYLFGPGLTDDVIAQSIQEASDFFNIDVPMAVLEDWTTGVMTGIAATPLDDILVFNREQMLDMGITDKEGFDLVMTHEGTHRMLQGLQEETGFNSYQEELCCDYVAGVRAGLNNMDFTKMQHSLANTTASETHPAGADRVEAIEIGVEFAHDYYNEHGKAPTFSECLEHFEQTEVYSKASISELVSFAPEFNKNSDMDKAAVVNVDNNAMSKTEESTSSLKAYSQDEINRKLSHAEKEQGRYESLVRHHTNMANHGLSKADTNYHLSEAEKYQTRANECANEAKKWRWTKPDKK